MNRIITKGLKVVQQVRLGRIVLLSVCCLSTMYEMKAQPLASDAMQAGMRAQFVPYNIASKGVEQPVRWGIDTAWLWDWWPLRATNHMRECVSLGRVTLNPRVSGNYTELDSDQKSNFDLQLSWLKKSGVKDLYLLAGNTSGTNWQTSYRAAFIKDIELSVLYLQSKGYNVTVISPFNEPDYGANLAPGPEEMAEVSRQIRQNPTLSTIDVCGPSTLNPDYAYSWWPIMKDAVQMGNTHQLAGTFDSFAGFYAAVQASGKKSTGDEMHNINDALIGMNYGMSEGIWWSDFGGYTRAELGCASNDGSRIGYAENRAAWTSAAVFKRKSQGLVEAFLGTSERQAGESAYTFLSEDRLVYYDGYGPFYEYTKATPGGTGYGTGQTNSEYVIEMTYGEDVPVGPMEGDFMIQNKSTGNLLTVGGVSTWTLQPIAPRSSGDFSYMHIINAANKSMYLDAIKYAANNGAGIQLYAGGGNECERWHFRYKGDGYYVITNHDSGLSLDGRGGSVTQWERTGTDLQLWRIIPKDATVETEAPDAPSGLVAEALSGSVKLSWEANAEEDLLGYMVYRYNEAAAIWETIGRSVSENNFIDNICSKGKQHQYRVRAVDKAWNVSGPSEVVSASTSVEPTLMAQWSLNGTLEDKSENKLHAVSSGVEYVTNDTHNGALFDGTDDYINLPYHVGDMKAMTFSAWVKVSATTAWQRVFDFGRNSQNYLFLTPHTGGGMRYEICKDGVKQGLDATKGIIANVWTHVVVTTGESGTKIYIDGKLNASTTEITLRPSDIAPNVCYLGRSFFDNDPLFGGVIGDVCLYNYDLDEEAVEKLFYHDQLSSANELLEKPMYKVRRQTLITAMENAETAIEEGDEDAITKALRRLKTAMTSARTSIDAYAPLADAVAWSSEMAETYPQSDTEALTTYSSQYDVALANLQEGIYTHAEVEDQVKVVKAFTNRYLMTEAIATATDRRPVDITFLLRNADFETNTSKYWTLTTNESGYNATVNYGCLEIWNHTFDLSQVLYGMPDGTYALKAQAFYRNGSKENSANTNVYTMVYVCDSTTATYPISRRAGTETSEGDWYAYTTGKNVPNDLEAASAAFNILNRYKPSNTASCAKAVYDADADGELVVGLKKVTAVYDDWTVVNGFQLQYYGGADLDAIVDVKTDVKYEGNGPVYDLTGREVDLNTSRKGVYILGGKKVLIK